jgi:prepilin-type N-terminal cleavage/methylation domain-containing protein
MFKHSQKGFSLLEVIIAMFIILIGLVGILSLANMSLKNASVSKMRLIASGLAQEGIEIVRDIRRSYSDWDDWYGAVVDGDYLVQYDSTSLVPYSETPLKLDKATGLYQYSSGDDTSFYRKVTLTKISANEVKVVAEVKWQLKGSWHDLTVEDRLWNWK